MKVKPIEPRPQNDRINKIENNVKELNQKLDSCLKAKAIATKPTKKKLNNVNDSVTTKKQ